MRERELEVKLVRKGDRGEVRERDIYIYGQFHVNVPQGIFMK